MMFDDFFGESLFDDFFDTSFPMLPAMAGHNPLYGKHARNLMKTDVREKADTYELDIDLPGFKKDEIALDLKDGYLTVAAAKSLDKDQEAQGAKYIRRERYSGKCSRSFYIGDTVDVKDVTAKFEDGILKISVPKHVQKELPASTSIAID